MRDSGRSIADRHRDGGTERAGAPRKVAHAAAVRNAIRAVEPVRLRPSPASSLRGARTPDTQDCPKFHLVQIVVVLVACLLEDIALTRRALSRELVQDTACVWHVVLDQTHHFQGWYWCEVLLAGSLTILAAFVVAPLLG